MLLWMEHATIDVVLWASSVSMLEKLPILMVPPDFGVWALGAATAGRAGQPRPAHRRPAERPKDGAAVDLLRMQLR